MDVVLTGSIAFDYLMSFPGQFREHVLPDRLDSLSLSFLVDKLDRQRGGVAANIAFTLALLGEKPRIMATAGEDFKEYRRWLEDHGVITESIRIIPGLFTASFFVTTDATNAQIASFYTGAMARAGELNFCDLPNKPGLAVISPNDPNAMARYVEECKEEDIPYIYDPSQQIVRLDSDSLKAGIEGSQGLFCNDYEFAMIEDKTGWSIEDLQEKTSMVVITRGHEGSDIYQGGNRIHIPAIAPRSISDPTGVGDAYRGGFLKAFIHDLDWELCGQAGAVAATYCLENRGPQGHRFDLDTFIDRFRRHFDDDGALDVLT